MSEQRPPTVEGMTDDGLQELNEALAARGPAWTAEWLEAQNGWRIIVREGGYEQYRVLHPRRLEACVEMLGKLQS